MGEGDCDIRIGTSGWHYAHWIGRFYPEKLRNTAEEVERFFAFRPAAGTCRTRSTC
jgi:hypothetical protein